ncbi:MAG: TonB-dependent receptor [Bryobacteraceae bacterium]|nr:TonB-dependent receptor [Bryobacteraceae bacterium]
MNLYRNVPYTRCGLWMLMALSAILWTGNLHGQVLYGALTGNVSDSSGAAVPGAVVEAVNVATGVARQTKSDERGNFLLADLQLGQYKVTISAPSFATVIQEGVTIELNTVRRLDARLQVAQVSESITIAASAVTLQTDRADVNHQISRSQVQNLPFAGNQGRNFQNLYKIIPGFSPPGELHSDAGNPQRALGTNVNGVSYSNNNTRLDGATVSYPWLPHIIAYVPPADAVETVNIVSNSFDAEQGMAGGSAVNVSIKSGTNEFHGSGHWYHTNSAVQARNFFFVGSELPKNLLNQFGGTLGGPIKKNKLFFFTDWERTTRREYASAFRTVPTAALRRGDFSGTGAQIYDPLTGNPNGTGRQLFPNGQIPASRIDPAAANMTALIPEPNLSLFPNNYFATGNYQFNRDNFDVKVNYNPTDRTSMFARYSISPSDIFDPPSLGPAGGDALAGGQPGNAPGRVQSASVGGTYTVSPSVLIDGNIGFTRQRLGAQNVDIDRNYGLEDLKIPGTNGPDRLQGGYPRFTISGFSSLGNPNVSNPFLFRDNQYVAVGNLSWVKGAHSLRFGGEYTYYTINHYQPQASNGPRGGFNFNGGLTALNGGPSPNLYNSWADWLLGLPFSLGKDVQYINPAAVRMPGYGFYARDQWQVTRKLTLNFGARFERYPFATRDHRGGERYDPATDKVLVGGLGGVPEDTGVKVPVLQVAPRLGIAYRATERTVVRAGYGISIDPDSFRYMRDSYPVTISSQFSGANSYQAAGSLRTGIPEIVGPDLSQGIIDLPLAVGTTTFPEEYRRGYIQSFNFTIQRDLGAGFNLQAGYVGSRAIRQTARVNINAAPPGGGNAGRALALLYPGRVGTINLYTPFSTSNYNSLQTQLRRTMAGGSFFGISYTWSKAISFADNNDSTLMWNSPEYWGRNRAPANFDRTHNLQVYGVYSLPFGKGKPWANSGIASWLFGGWQVNGIMSILSGTPFTITSAGNSINAPGNSQTADQVVGKVRKLGQVGPGTSWFDPAAFMPVTEQRFGNVGRNSMRGPGSFNLDASLFRSFHLTESTRLEFRAESFSLTNTPQFGNPNGNASAPTRDSSGAIRSLNNFSSITSASGSRQVRFAIKLFF